MKVCNKCGRELPESYFYRAKTTSDGLQTHCKECQSEYLKKYRKEMKDSVDKVKKKAREPLKELSRFSDEQLTVELFARGYKGKITKRVSLVF